MKYDVSVVIVCMNNYDILRDCLDSIKEYNKEVSYEVLLVAYFFSKENLEKLKANYPWVKIIESNEIRGFSANNNLALRQAQGEYCFVLNDDTYMRMPVIDMLYKSAKAHPEATIISPQIRRKDGTIQYSGTKPLNWKSMLRSYYKIHNDAAYDPKSKWCGEKGFFQTYNILGAAFLINTEKFKELGFLDEKYFYGPEDIALSTLVNETGGKVYVDAEIKITHLVGGTGGATSKTVCATRPANRKGDVLFHSKGKKSLELFLSLMIFINSLLIGLGFLGKRILGNKYAMYSFKGHMNVCTTIFSGKTTTEIFKKYYKPKRN